MMEMTLSYCLILLIEKQVSDQVLFGTVGLEIGIRMVCSAWEALRTFEIENREWWSVGVAMGYQAGIPL